MYPQWASSELARRPDILAFTLRVRIYDADRTRGQSVTAPMTREGSRRPVMQPGLL